jgi:hypothetical protein
MEYAIFIAMVIVTIGFAWLWLIEQQKKRKRKVRKKEIEQRAPDQDSWRAEATRPAAIVALADVRFSNRPFGVKHFQTIHHHSVDVARGLVLLFGIGTRALPSFAHDQTDRYPRTEVQEHDPWDDEEDDVIVEGCDDVVKKPAPLTNAEACRYVWGA